MHAGIQQAFQRSSSLSSHTVVCLNMFVVGVDFTVYRLCFRLQHCMPKAGKPGSPVPPQATTKMDPITDSPTRVHSDLISLQPQALTAH